MLRRRPIQVRLPFVPVLGLDKSERSGQSCEIVSSNNIRCLADGKIGGKVFRDLIGQPGGALFQDHSRGVVDATNTG